MILKVLLFLIQFCSSNDMFNFDDEQLYTIKARIDFLQSLNLLKGNGYEIPKRYTLEDIDYYMYDEGTKECIIIDFFKSIFKDCCVENIRITSEIDNYEHDKYGYDIYGDFTDDGGDIQIIRLDITSPLIKEYLNILKENNIKTYNSEAEKYLNYITNNENYEIIFFSSIALDYSCIYICMQYPDYSFLDVCKYIVKVKQVMEEAVSNYRKHKKTKWSNKRYVYTRKEHHSKGIIKKNIIKNRNKYINVKKKEKFNRKRMLRRLS